MGKVAKKLNTEKFMKLSEDKRDRIINAAMKEFCYGFKKASTDIIVRVAGISKGLLFHYFGTKDQLYAFLVQYASDIIQRDYMDVLNLGKQDILEGFWQIALLKKEIVNQHPFLYDFINGLYIHVSDIPSLEITELFEKRQQYIYDEVCKQCNFELFIEGIEHRKAIDVIILMMESLFDDEDSKAISAGGWDDQNYEGFLENLRGYLDFFRACFYKK